MIAFDDDGSPVEAVDFEFPADDGSRDAGDHHDVAADAIGAFLRWAIEGGSADDVARRVIVLASACRIPGAPRTTRELGRVLNVSHVTAGAMLSKIRAESLGKVGNSLASLSKHQVCV